MGGPRRALTAADLAELAHQAAELARRRAPDGRGVLLTCTRGTNEAAVHLYAAVLAQACNFGLANMSEVADLSARQLAWTTEWYLREESLQAATDATLGVVWPAVVRRRCTAAPRPRRAT